MTETLIILGVVILSFALRTVQLPIVRKAGALGFLVATFLTGYFISGKIWVGILSMLLWFLVPWIELLTRTRKLRLPVNRTLKKVGPPGSQRFPELGSMTDEIEEEEFEYVSDTGWEWEETNQFFRFFYHQKNRVQAAICFTEQPAFSWACISLTSRHNDGRIFRSTNLPFNNPMKSAPDVIVRRNWTATTFADFVYDHQEWLTALGCEEEDFLVQDPEETIEQVERETGSQITHNVESGIIALCEKADTWRYSWRGLWYVYLQVLKDVVKWC